MPRESKALALSESVKHQEKLDELIGVSLALQKLYGRDVANSGHVINLFQRILAKYPADRAIKAFELWLERSQEFPTPADIIGLIKRNGRPPIKESDVIAVRKKYGADRSSDDWQLLREWDKQQNEEWGGDYEDNVKDTATEQENIKLRQKLKEMEFQLVAVNESLKSLRVEKGVAKPEYTKEEKVRRTIEAMRSEGAKQEDIEDFTRQMHLPELAEIPF